MVVENDEAIMQQLKENTNGLEELKGIVLEVKKELQELKELLKAHKGLSFQIGSEQDQMHHPKSVPMASVNMVISSSDTLTTSGSEVQPALSIIIPSQHHFSVVPNPAPFAFHISLPSQTPYPKPSALTKEGEVFPSEERLLSNVPMSTFSAISPGKQGFQKSQEESKDNKYLSDFKSVISLPMKVELTTGEEDETIVFQSRANLYRFVEKEWKERGVGQLKLLFNTVTKKGRVLMRREQVLKVCANHHITPDIQLTAMNDRAWMWVANDFTDEEVRLEILCTRFRTAEEARNFKKAFEKVKGMVVVTPGKCKENSSLVLKKSGEKVANNATMSKNDSLIQPASGSQTSTISEPVLTQSKLNLVSFSNFKSENKTVDSKNSSKTKQTAAESENKNLLFNFTFSSASKTSPVSVASFPSSNKNKQFSSEIDTEESKLTSSFVLGGSDMGLSFASLAQQAGKFRFKKDYPAPEWQQDVCVFGRTAPVKDDDHVEDFVSFGESQPIVSLTKLVEVKTGEEELKILYQQRAKLFRFDKDEKQWKERGIGQMKVLLDSTTGRTRLLMRREQVLKVCCNHYVVKDMKFISLIFSDKAWMWYAQDYSEEELKPDLFAIKFKTLKEAQDFKAVIDRVQFEMKFAKAIEFISSKSDSSLVACPYQGGSIKQSSFRTRECVFPCFPNSRKYISVKKKRPLQHKATLFLSSSNRQGKQSEICKPKEGFWSCNKGYVSGVADREQCGACETKKPREKCPSDDSKLVDLLKAKDGLWYCNSCFVSNDVGKDKCIVCGRNRSATNKPPKPTKPFRETSKLSADSWECKVCYIKNSSSTSLLNNAAENKCIACGSIKRVTVAKKLCELVKPASKLLKPSSDHCECKVCYISNESNTTLLSNAAFDECFSCFDNCVTTTAEEPPEPTTCLSEMFKPSADTRMCRMCYVRYNNSDGMCVGCGTMNSSDPATDGKQETLQQPPSQFETRSQSSRFQMNSVSGFSQVGRASDVELKFSIQPEMKTSSSAPQIGNNISDKPFKFSSSTKLPVFQFGVKSSDDKKKVVQDEVHLVGEVEATAEEQQEARRLMLPPNFYLYRSKPSCPGCRGCEPDSDQEVAPESVEDSSNSIVASTPQHASSLNCAVSNTPLVTEATSSATTSSVFGSSDTFHVESDNMVSEVLSVVSSTSLVASCSNSATATQSSYSYAAFQAVSCDTAPSCTAVSKTIQQSIVVGRTAEVMFGDGCTDTQECAACVFGSSISVLSSSKTACITTIIPAVPTSTEMVDSGTGTPSTENASVFVDDCESAAAGETPSNEPEVLSVSSTSNQKHPCDEQNSSPTFCIPVSNQNKTTFATAPPKLSDSHSKSFLSNMQATEPSTEDDARHKEGVRWQNFAQKGGLVDCCNTPRSKKGDTKEEDENKSRQDTCGPHDPQFKPAIPLPDVIEVCTGEEEEEKVFGERAKLYRFDINTKEWKEKGVGEMKILWHPVNNTYRLLQRREQVHSIVCNHLITADLELKPVKSSSKRALCWGALNHAHEGKPEIEKLAVRFSSSEILETFKHIFEECRAEVRKLKLTTGEAGSDNWNTQRPYKRCPTLLSSLKEHHYEGDDEDEDDNDSYGDDSDLGVVFEKDDVHLLRKDNGQSVEVGITRITVEFDDRCHLGHIYAFCEDMDHPISDVCIDDNCTFTVEGFVCVWTGLDTKAKHRNFSIFSADMTCATDLEDFKNAVDLCRKMWYNPNPKVYDDGSHGDI